MTRQHEVTDGCARPAAMIAALIIALLLLPKCGRGQSFTAPFHLRVSPETVTASHAIAKVSIDSFLTVRVVQGNKAVHRSRVQSVEVRESSTMYILQDGVCHYKTEPAGQMIAWLAGGFNWIFYDHVPGEVMTTTKRD